MKAWIHDLFRVETLVRSGESKGEVTMIIQSQRVWIAGQFIPAQLEVEGEKIVSVLAYGTKKADKDYGEMRLVPGFIDVHTHGAYGFDTNDAEPEGLRD